MSRIEDVYPLSPLQEGLLYETLNAPGTGVYVTQLYCRALDLDVAAFERAWRWVVARHAVLRSAFAWKSTSRPLQLVIRDLEVPVRHVDWRGLPEARVAPALERLLVGERERGFDPARPPLMRLLLLRTGRREHRLVWSHHHLLLDGWSYALVLKELGEAYLALLRDRPGEGPERPAPRPYKDFVGWLETVDRAAGAAWWRRLLEGFVSPTSLWVDAGPEVAAPAGERRGEQQLVLAQAVSDALRAAGRRHRLTLGSLMLGAWALLLSRYSGERDVVFGSVFAGRPPELEGVETMVGLFINTLPVRARVRHRQAAAAWLQALQAQQVEQRQHAHLPLSELQRASGVPAGTPLFATLFAFENYPVDEMVRTELEALQATDFRAIDHSGLPLAFSSSPKACLPLGIDHDRRRFEPAVVARMLGHLAALLGGLAADPGQPTGDLPLLAAEERRQLLAAWNRTATAYPAAACIHELWSAQAARAPEAVAVVCGAAQLSYGELERRATALASRLRRLGVGPEVVAGLLAGRQPALAVGLLAIWKAGGACLPLDPAQPGERLRLMLADSGASLVLAAPELCGLLPAGLTVVPLAAEDAVAAAASPAAIAWPAAHPDNLAYVVYTSGSSGRPKGVMVAHRPLVNFAVDAARRFHLGAADRILQFSPQGFNVLFEELLPIWLEGGAVVLHPGIESLDLDGLTRLVTAQAVTCLELPAAYWHQWVDELDAAGPPASLRFVILGCEKPLPGPVARWRGWGVGLVHVFGLTEATITSTLFELPPGGAGGLPAGDRDLPIGRPLANTTIYLLDDRLEPVPPGVAGELYIGGVGLGRGYRAQPALTAERFVPDPFSAAAVAAAEEASETAAAAAASGSRLYRSGDLARWRPDGNLELLGRCDQQLKIRGHRIEPEEIAAALLAHPAVREAAVAPRSLPSGPRRLVAWLVPRGALGDLRREAAGALPADLAAALPEAAALRAFLRHRLPEPMLPADFVWLPRLPRTSTGKLDYRALPAPVPPAAGNAAAGGAAPRDRREQALVEVWQEALGIERIGVHDDFFALGGDSILSLQIVSRALRAGLRITPRQLFERPTIAELAAAAEVLPAAAAAAPPAGAVTGPVPLTPIQHWFFGLGLRRPHWWNMPLQLAPRRPLAPALLARALRLLWEHHDALRLRFTRSTMGWRQAIAGPEERPPRLGVVDLLRLPPERRGAAGEAAAARLQQGFDLERGPLLRAVYLRRGGTGGDRLLLLAHHLVMDVVSWQVVAGDLGACYTRLEQEREPELPPRTTSFRTWAEELRAQAEDPGLAGAELDGWLRQTAGELAALPRSGQGENRRAAAAEIEVSLPRDETRALLDQAGGAYRTAPRDLLLAALARVLVTWAGGPLLVDVESHGRADLGTGFDLSRTVGWFTSLYPLRFDPADAGEPGAAIKSIKERLRRVPRQGIGHGLLVALSPAPGAAELRRRPRAEVLFNYLGRLDAPGSGASLFTLAAEPLGPAAAPDDPRGHRLEINAALAGGCLRVRFGFARGLNGDDEIDGLAQRFLAELRRLLAHCLRPEAGACTPSDFPMAGLDQEALDRLLGAGRDVEDLYPLAPVQHGMLLHALLEPERRPYLAQSVFELLGEVDAAALRRAWEEVLAAHPVLRSGFAWKGLEVPLQVVRRAPPLPWRTADWRGLAEPELQWRLRDELRADRERGLDLEAAPLLRLALLRTGERRRHLVWTFFQGLLDGWSLPVLLAELLARYRALTAGPPYLPPAGPPERPYRDYIAWLGRRDAGADRTYWQGLLAGFTTPTALVSTLAAGAEPAATGPGAAAAAAAAEAGTLSVELPPGLGAAVAAFARGRQLTLNTVLQGAWSLLLGRGSGEDDVVFGATFSGRPPELPGVERMIGVFLNTLPVRVALRPGDPLGGWLAALQRQLVASRAYESAPLADIQAWSDAPPGVALFESIVVFENYPLHAMLQGAEAGFLLRPQAGRERTHYPLALTVMPEAAVGLRFKYDAGRFAAADVGRLASQLETLLAGFAAHPGARLADLPRLSPGERQQLLEWNDTAAPELDRGGESGVYELFVAAAGRSPDAVALVFAGQALTYAETARRAGSLAACLRAAGVGAESRVGVLAERALELVPALLAVLAAGAAYLPLDPELPAERLAFMLADSGASLLLAQRRWAALAGALAPPGVPMIWLDGPVPAVPPLPPAPAAGGDHPAYVIYTSGSTGKPKGVMVPHRGIVNRLLWAQRALALTAADGVLQKTPFTFDVSVGEQFLPLLAGARLVLAEPGGHRDGAYLRDLIAAEGITSVHFVPSMLQVFLDTPGLARCRTLRQVLASGEALASEVALRFFERLPAGVELHNLYGPTEASVEVSWWPCDAGGDWRRRAGVPIGRPIANCQLWVLDREGEPLPIGVTGELHLGGVALARGYLGRADVTAERFVPRPPGLPGGAPGERLYRSGDLARLLPSGAVEFLGRRDHQVKVRGFRVELGEIESALLACPGVAAAAVVHRPDAAGAGGTLVAFVATGAAAEEAQATGTAGLDGLAALLRARLPAYMVPGAFIQLPALPLTASGKVDRAALQRREPRGGAAVPGAAQDAPAGAGGAPRTPLERRLAELWRQLLEVPEVGVEDSFFALGGHSLTVARLLARVGRDLDVEVPLRTFFGRPTIAGLAMSVTQLRAEQADQDEVARLVAELEELPEESAAAELSQERR